MSYDFFTEFFIFFSLLIQSDHPVLSSRRLKGGRISWTPTWM